MERDDMNTAREREIWDYARNQGYDLGREALAEALHATPKNSNDRREFIRDAAIQMAVAFRLRDQIVSMSLSDAKQAWQAGLLLWDAKPEDC